MHATVQQFLGNLFQVVDLRHRHHRIAAQVRVHENRLRICIADHTDALMAGERVELIFELRTEIVTLQVMDLTAEALLGVEGHQSGATCAEMRVVVGAVEQVVDATLCRYGSKESSHVILFLFIV